MRRALLLSTGLAVSIAACSAGAPEDAAGEQPQSVPSGAPAAGSTPAAKPGLSAKVSPLSGTVSGLDTRITDMGTVIDLPSDALFEYDKSALTQAAETELRKAAKLIAQSPPGAIHVIGHTDSKGDDAYNQTLSEARAKTVADWFRQQVGVRQREFRVSGQGETAPIAPNETADGTDDPAGRARNRRVEVIVPTQGP